MGIIKDCPRSPMEKCTDKYGCVGACAAVEQFEKEWREESAQSEPEPVAWMNPKEESDGYAFSFKQQGVFTVPLYTAPPKKEWQGLTDEEIGAMEKEYLFGGKEFDDEIGYWAVYRAIEAKLKEKNNAT